MISYQTDESIFAEKLLFYLIKYSLHQLASLHMDLRKRFTQNLTYHLVQKNLWFFCGIAILFMPHRSMAQNPYTKTAIRLAVIGDYGWSGADEKNVSDLVNSWNVDAILTTGDNNYPDGEASSLDKNIGQYYHPYIYFLNKKTNRRYHGETPLKQQRFFPALGNHDWNTPGALPYLSYFKLPGNGRYYQQRLGPIDLFVIDSDAHEPDGITAQSTQALWLKQALQQSNASWKIVSLHHSPFSSGKHGSEPQTQWPYKAWGANLILSGHDHHYERLMHENLTYVVCGFSGAPLYTAQTFHSKTTHEIPAADYQQQAVYFQQHGALLIEAQTTIFSAKAINVSKEVIDHFQFNL